MAAITYNEQLKARYKIKVTEGKNIISVFNAARNKLVLRMAVVIQVNKQYVKVKTAAQEKTSELFVLTLEIANLLDIVPYWVGYPKVFWLNI